MLDAIRRGPAILAQEFLTTQHFTQGRAIFVLAAGEWKNIGPYGYDHRLRDSRLVETAGLVRHFLETQEPISYAGRFWTLEDAVVELPPYEGVPPPLWLAGGGPKVLEAVGRFADGWVVYTPGGVDRPPGAHRREARDRARACRARRPRSARRSPARRCRCCSAIPIATRSTRWLDHPFMQWHALTGFPFGKAWRDYGHVHPLGDDWSITLAGNMATMPLDRVLDLCRQVPRDDGASTRSTGARPTTSCRASSPRSRRACATSRSATTSDSCRAPMRPAATQALVEVARRVRAAFPDLAREPTLVGP